MYDRTCPNGHVVTDPTALRCPVRGCGEWVDGAVPTPAPRRERTSHDSSPSIGLRLILVSFVLSVVTGFLWGVFSDESSSGWWLDPETGEEAVQSAVIGLLIFVAQAAFLVGCVAEGVRLGNKNR
jgi:hypothetical protein